jgi:hypothetical protein
VEVCIAIGIMVARALSFAHNPEYIIYGKHYHGVIHRDLKPNNIMVARDGTVKLMDFGIARPIDASIHTTDNSSVLGTMQYLSPELLEGKSADIRTDIYSLGAVLYEAITGTKAFPESNISTLMMRKIKNEYRSLDSFTVKIPPRFKRLVQQCMNRDRDKRPGCADEIIAELGRVHKGLTSLSPESMMCDFMAAGTSVKTVVSLKRRLPVRRIAVFCAVAVLVAAAVFSVRFIKKHPHAATPPPVVAAPTSSPQNVPSVKKVQETMLGKTKRAPVPVSAAQRGAKSAADLKRPKESDLAIAELKQQYGTDNMAEIFAREEMIGHHQQAQKVYDQLTTQQKESKPVVLYGLRMFDAVGDRGRLSQLLAMSAIEDGEFYLAKAREFYREENTAKCLAYLDLSAKTRCTLLNPTALRQDMLYYKALCYSREFESHPSKMTMQNALDSWFEVKLLFRATPEHNYFQKAVSEMQRISDKGKEIKG